MRVHTMLVRNYYENKGTFVGINEQPWFEYTTNWEELCGKDIGQASVNEMACFEENKLIKKYKPLREYKGVQQDDLVTLNLLVRYFTTCIDTYVRYTQVAEEDSLLTVSAMIQLIASLPAKETAPFVKFYIESGFKIKNIKSDCNAICNGVCLTKKEYTEKEWDEIVTVALDYLINLYKLLPKRYRRCVQALAYISIDNMSVYKNLLVFATKEFGSYKKFLDVLGVDLPDESLAYEAYGILIYNLDSEYLVVSDYISGGSTIVDSLEELVYCIPQDKLHNVDKLTGGK